MNPKERKRLARKRMMLPAGELKEITDLNGMPVPPGMTRAWINNRFVVMIYDNSPTDKGPAIRVMVQRHDDTPIPNHWFEMQRIKNKIFGEQTTAVEYYPAENELVDMHQIYWMWIFENGILPKPIFTT